MRFCVIFIIDSVSCLQAFGHQRENPSLAPEQGAVASLPLCLDAYLSGVGVVVECDAGLPVLVELQVGIPVERAAVVLLSFR